MYFFKEQNGHVKWTNGDNDRGATFYRFRVSREIVERMVIFQLLDLQTGISGSRHSEEAIVSRIQEILRKEQREALRQATSYEQPIKRRA